MSKGKQPEPEENFFFDDLTLDLLTYNFFTSSPKYKKEFIEKYGQEALDELHKRIAARQVAQELRKHAT